jgi:hypothetical protein
MANNLVTDNRSYLHSSAWHAGIEIALAPTFTQFIFSFLGEDELDPDDEYLDSYTQTRRTTPISDFIPQDDFSYISFTLPV